MLAIVRLLTLAWLVVMKAALSLVSPTVSSAENASPTLANDNGGGNIPVSVSHSSPVVQTSGNQSAEFPAAKIGTEASKPSPNTEVEANAIKVTTVPSVPVSSPTSSAPVAAPVAGQPSVPAKSLTPSAPPVPSAATNVKPPTVSFEGSASVESQHRLLTERLGFC